MCLSHRSSGPPRQGVILLVVVLMLALFLVVGLAFVLYSESALSGSRIYMESQTPDLADVAPETLSSWAWGQLIYGANDDSNGVLSAMRGHSLARTMYGWGYVDTSTPGLPNAALTNVSTNDPTQKNVFPFSSADTMPYNGIGPLRTLPLPGSLAGSAGITEYELVNYTWNPIDGFVRDPEHWATRTAPNQQVYQVGGTGQFTYTGGFNAPYTYPDRTNMFLGAVKATNPYLQPNDPNQSPVLLALSFVRPTANVPFSMIDPTTANGQTFWNAPPAQQGGQAKSWWKYATLRPRPGDQLWSGETLQPSPTGNGWIARNAQGAIRPAFPPPIDLGGDVKQLPGVPFFYKNANGQLMRAQNDSYWMDLNYPVQVSRNGKKFKPLFAFLILDLDGRVNLNTDGNLNAITTVNGTQTLAHASNQGLGRHEINISKILNADQTASAAPAEWRNLYTGAVTATFNAGRYGLDKMPGSGSLATNNALADPYAPNPITGESFRSLIFPLDVDAIDPANNRAVTTKFALPLTGFNSFPLFSTTGYDNYTFDATKPQNNPRLNHPLLNQKLRATYFNTATSPAVGNVPSDDQPIGNENLYYLLAGDYRKSALFNLIPQNLGGPGISTAMGNQIRQLITPTSFDLDVPGASPWVTSSRNSQYVLAGTSNIVNSTLGNYPTGQPMPTPAPAQISSQNPAPGDHSDFKASDGRANLLSRLDLNRKLTPYNDANGLFNGGKPIPAPVPASSLTPGLLAIHPEYRYYMAANDRQQFAQDIFNRLVQATGAMSPDTVGPPVKAGSLHQASGASTQNYAATRWLAQLAANMVDYIDDDDVMTAFNWNPAPDAAISGGDTGWVFGVEAPKLVVNEAYCELQNDPTDTTAAVSGAKLPFQYNFWLELYNPMSAPALPNTIQPVAITTSNVGTNGYLRPDPNKVSSFVPVAQDRMAVQLQRQSAKLGTYPVYQIQIVTEPPDANANPPTSFMSPSNNDGSVVNPKAINIQVTGFNADLGAAAGAPANSPTPYPPDASFVQPNIGAFNIPTTAGGPPSNTGFYVMGPDSKHPFSEKQQAGGITLRPTINLRDQGTTPSMTSVPWGQAPDPSTGQAGTAKNALTYTYQGPIPMTSPQTIARRTHTMVLRRLACPNLDPNPINPQTKQLVNANAPYNPYVTVDYLTGVPTYDAVQYIASPNPLTIKNTDYQDPSARHSIGRVQPYNAAITKPQTSSSPNPVHNTFFSHNSQTPPPTPTSASTQNQQNITLDWPFDWLTFADRTLTNVAEIMNVPTTPPHLLTHAFGYNPTTKQRDLTNHLAPWGRQDARIYRALEFFTVGDRSPYPGTGGRVAGKVNVNTVFDPQIADAFIDAQTNSNNFTEQAVLDVWQGKLKDTANPSDPANLSDPTNNSFQNRKQQILGLTGATLPDKPFMSLAAPVVPAGSDQQYPTQAFPTGVGLPNTIAPYLVDGAAGAAPTLNGTFIPQTGNTPPSINYPPPPNGQQIPPFVMNELFTKVDGHLTNRSNTFAVFLTVGFFEVVDDTTLPVKLGAEITTAGGKNIRHQMFSIVDRTNLALAFDPAINDASARLRQAPTPPIFMSAVESVPAGATSATLTIAGGLPTDYDGTSPVVFKTGQTLYMDMGVNQEAVQVQSINTALGQVAITFPFSKNGQSLGHSGSTMLCTYQPGNPGPQGPIDYGSPQYKAVVPYTYIIQ